MLQDLLETKDGNGQLDFIEESIAVAPFEVVIDTTPFEVSIDTTPFEVSIDTTPFEVTVDVTPFRVTLGKTPLELSVVTTVGTGTTERVCSVWGRCLMTDCCPSDLAMPCPWEEKA